MKRQTQVGDNVLFFDSYQQGQEVYDQIHSDLVLPSYKPHKVYLVQADANSKKDNSKICIKRPGYLRNPLSK